MSSRSLAARGILLTVLTQIVSVGLGLFLALYVPRYVGPSNNGKFVISAVVSLVLSAVVPLGTSFVLVKEIARDHARLGELLLGSIAIRLVVGTVSSALALFLARALGYDQLVFVILAIQLAGMLIGALNDAFCAALQGLERLGKQNIAIIADKFLGAALLFTLVKLRAPVWSLALAGVVSTVLQLGLHLWTFRNLWKLTQPLRLESVRQLATNGLPFMGSLLFRNLYGQTDPLVLSRVVRDNELSAGLYGTAGKLVGSPLFLPVAVTTVLLPSLARAHALGDRAQFAAVARRALEIVLLCGIPIGVIMVFLGDHLVRLAFPDPRFNGCIPVLRVGGVSVLLYFVAIVLGTLVTASDGQRALFRASVVAAAVGIPLCVLGCYVGQRQGNAAVGAIVTDVLVEIGLILFYLVVLPRGIFGRATLLWCTRCFLAALPMVGLLLVGIRVHRELWMVLPAVASYLLACIALRCIDRGYVRLLKEAVGAR